MANKYVNKLIVGTEVKLDLTGDTIVPVSYTHLRAHETLRQVRRADHRHERV